MLYLCMYWEHLQNNARTLDSLPFTVSSFFFNNIRKDKIVCSKTSHFTNEISS